MASEAELLNAICAEPERDEPRLVYAAWLDERGDPRGDLIRASCTPGCEARVAQLLALHGDRWASVLGELFWELSHPPVFERGFIAELHVMGTFAELVLDFAERLVTLRPVPVAVIAGGDRVLVRADRRVYASRPPAGDVIVVGSLPDGNVLATTARLAEPAAMLGFVGDRLRYRVGTQIHDLVFSVS